jgi:hypothetical protein
MRPIVRPIANGPLRRPRRADRLSRLRMPALARSTAPEEPGLGTPDPRQRELALVRQAGVKAQRHEGMQV